MRCKEIDTVTIVSSFLLLNTNANLARAKNSRLICTCIRGYYEITGCWIIRERPTTHLQTNYNASLQKQRYFRLKGQTLYWDGWHFCAIVQNFTLRFVKKVILKLQKLTHHDLTHRNDFLFIVKE
jgi:hypothetical protein